MPDLKDIWRLVQVMNDLKAWRFILILMAVFVLGVLFIVQIALPGVAAIITACR